MTKSVLTNLTIPNAITATQAAALGQITVNNLIGVLPVSKGGTGSTTLNYVDLVSTQTNIAGNKAFTGTVSSSKYTLGSDLSLIPVVGGQSAITTWWGLQLVGNKQSNIDYTPANIGAIDDFSVIIPNQQPSKIGLVVQGAVNQTGSLQTWRDSNANNVGSIDNSGNLNIDGIFTPLGGVNISKDIKQYFNSTLINNTSSTFVLLTGMSLSTSSIRLVNYRVKIIVYISSTSNNTVGEFVVYKDNVADTNTLVNMTFASANDTNTICIEKIYTGVASPSTLALNWRRVSGTGTLRATSKTFILEEVI